MKLTTITFIGNIQFGLFFYTVRRIDSKVSIEGPWSLPTPLGYERELRCFVSTKYLQETYLLNLFKENVNV